MDASYSKLTSLEQEIVKKNLEIRRKRFERLVLKRGAFNAEFKQPSAVIVGDRPGPAAPLDPSYHHTPFYSIKHCSGWLNTLLFLEGIDENELSWVNAYDKDGTPTDPAIVEDLSNDFTPRIIALGGNAEKWLKKNGFPVWIKVDHPQYHKRFKNKQNYQLIPILKDLLYPGERAHG